MARLIPQKQIEALNIPEFETTLNLNESLIVSGSLIVSQSFILGSNADTVQKITGSVQLSGSLTVDGGISFVNPETTLNVTASISNVSLDSELFNGISSVDFGANESTLYVSSTSGNDSNDGRTPQYPLKTIKRACELVSDGDDGRFGIPTSSLFTGYRIEVAAGTYLEDNPITVPKNTTIWGAGLRVTKILAKNKTFDLFWVNSGCYLAEMTFGNLEIYPSLDDAQRGFAITFAPNAFITTSPYVQNCSLISNQENSFLELYEDIPPGGGGLNVDGNKVHPDSPLASMVLDAYTQVSPNGIGCQVVGKGFIQLVSFFTNFSAYAVKVIDGGQAVLLNSNTSFGDFGMYASGSRFITGSVGNVEAFNSVKDGYSIIINTIEDGLGAIPDVVLNTANGIRITDPTVIPQYFTSEDSSQDVADIVSADFELVSSIVEQGVVNMPALIAKSSTAGYNSGSVYNITGGSQYTSSVSASQTELTNLNTNFDVILGIVENGIAFTSSYEQISNVTQSIKINDISQYTGLGGVSTSSLNAVTSSFDTVLGIVTNGIDFSPTVIKNTNSNVYVTDVSYYETDITASAVTISSVSSSFSIVCDIIANGTGSAPSIVFSSSIADPSIEKQNAYTLLTENIPFIQAETIAYLSSSWSQFDYNEASCSRDLGLIVSGAAHDLLYGGNEESVRNGEYYYLFPSQATTTQLNQTLDGIRYAAGVVGNILNGVTYQTTTIDNDNAYNLIVENKQLIQAEVISYISASWSDFDYNEASCSRDVGFILDAVATDLRYGGNERSVVAGQYYYNYPSDATVGQLNQTLDGIKYAKELTNSILAGNILSLPSETAIASYNLLKENKQLIQSESIVYVNTEYPNFVYNETSCSRDVGYIVDAVATDLLYGGNYRSETAGVYYYLYPSVATGVQLDETLEAIRYVKGFSEQIIQSNLLDTPQIILNTDGNVAVTAIPVSSSVSGTLDDVTSVSSSFATIQNIIRNGVSVTPDVIYNYDGLYKFNDIDQTTSSIQVSSAEVTKVSESFALVNDIVFNGISALPEIVENISGSIKATNAVQTTLSVSGSITQQGYISSSVGVVNDIITYGSSSVSFALAKNFVHNLDTPKNLTQRNYVTGSGDFTEIQLANGLASFTGSFDTIIDIITNGTSVAPTLVLNSNAAITRADTAQYIGLNNGGLPEVTKVSSSINIIETIVNQGTGSLPKLVESNTDVTNLIKAGNVSQYTAASGAGQLQSKIVSASFGTVIDIIVNGTGSLPTIKEYETRIDAPDMVLAYDLLKNNIGFIEEETILFMSSSWSTFVYDESKCRRDVGLIVSGAAEDLIYNANSASVVNGKFYYDFPSQATTTQLDQTVTALKYASNLAQNVVRNRTYVNVSSDVSASYDLLINNKEFIQAETIAFVSSSWSDFDYNEVSCSRDVGYIVDAAATDLFYGGNERSITAGKYYYQYPSAAIVGGVPNVNQQKDPTVTAINYVKNIASEIVGGTVFVTSSLENQYIYDSVRINKGYIKDEVISFVNAKYPDLVYSEASCSRDVGFIIDAVTTDLIYGGNQRSVIAGDYYYRFPSQATGSQLEQTVDAIQYASDLSKEIILKNELQVISASLNTDNGIKRTGYPQVIGIGAYDSNVDNSLSASFGIVMDIVANGIDNLPTIIEYTTPSTDPNVLNAYSLVKQNIPFIQAETIAYLSSSWSQFDYNEASCSRDVGLIVSGAIEDLLFSANSASVVNGEYYYLFPSQATTTQLNQTLDGIRYAAGLTSKIAQGTTFEYASNEASASWELLTANREFIQDEVIAYLSSSWNGFEYNQASCSRDVGHVIDAIKTDLYYGGNERSVNAGIYYYLYPSDATTTQVHPTVTGIKYAGDIAQKIIVNSNFASASPERIAANELLLSNKNFIQREVISYISSSWSDFDYNEASCSRDVGFIVNAVATDVLYGGNERSYTAGKFYYEYPSDATTTQIYPTTDGIKYAGGISDKIIQNGLFVTQSQETSAAWNLLRLNRELIKDEAIAFVSSSWSGVYYNEAKCRRDVGYLVDAAATDLFYGGNERSIVAGSFYYLFPSRATNKGVPSEENQLDPTIDGIKYAGELSQKIIQCVDFKQPKLVETIGADLIANNKSFIQAETIAYLSSSWSQFQYNEVSCSRDIGYILDAVRTDLLYGGNERSVKAGTFYYYIPSVATTEQKPQTIDGIDFARGVTEKCVIKQQIVRPSLANRQSAQAMLDKKASLQERVINYTNNAFPDFVYNEASCSRDTGYIIDGLVTDLLYGGNERSVKSARSYYTGVYGDASVVVNEQKQETAEANRFLRTRLQIIATNAPMEEFGSLIITTGHDFSYAGSGVTYKALPPNQGGNGTPDPDKEVVELGGGRVFFTSGNELGDFRIGTGLVINQATGTLQGRTFSRSLFSLVTPFSLALEA